MKRVGCDPHSMTSKGASLKRRSSGHMRANVEECHDAIEEDDASSNTPPRKVGIEDMLRHKQDRDIKIDMKGKDRLVGGQRQRHQKSGFRKEFGHGVRELSPSEFFGLAVSQSILFLGTC